MSQYRTFKVHPLVAELDRRRQAMGVSQKHLAERIGITQVTMSNILTGRSRATLEVVEALATTLGCRLVLLAGNNEMLPVAPLSGQPSLTKLAQHQREIVRLMELMAGITDDLANALEAQQPPGEALPG